MKLVKEHIAPKKSLGQNFLIDNNIIEKTVDALEVNADDIVMEIGPGEGALTEKLLSKAKHVYAVEIDERAYELLLQKFKHCDNFTIFNEDFLKFDFSKIPNEKKIKVLGNVPYYISGRIFFRLFQESFYFSKAVITVQKEVGQRIIATANTKQYGILSVLRELVGEARLAFDISPNCFYPRPKIMSSLVVLDFKDKFENYEFKKVASIVKMAFSKRRKKISNALKEYLLKVDVLSLKEQEILDSLINLRAENLKIDDYLDLYRIFVKLK